ncbi:PH domain-containing protein [Companilactobacillus zhongbaensis]|uniref:PH domain-containing protein n=1 Tax=Companilactobacillus zhongbaensis TaxID=2486009 RepID=UPI000F76E918|nr:PH domain-containing protein [Companilactobacillus zhongbaensis]
MGLFGNASVTDKDSTENNLSKILIDGESVQLSYKLIRDKFVFTNKRLIIINVQGLSGSKTSYRSIPYRSISRFSIETTGTFDIDAELKIWISGQVEPSESYKFSGDNHIYDIQRALATAIL